jgi:hypothetical protein
VFQRLAQGCCKGSFAAAGGAKRGGKRGRPTPRKGTTVPLTPVGLLGISDLATALTPCTGRARRGVGHQSFVSPTTGSI